MWSFFTKSTKCLKLCGASMIWLVQLCYQYQNKFTKLLQCTYTDTKPSVKTKWQKHLFPFVYLLHIHITSCLLCSWKQQMTFLNSTLQYSQLQIFKSTPSENYKIHIYRAKLSVSSTTTGFRWLCIATMSAGTASFMTEHMALDSSS